MEPLNASQFYGKTSKVHKSEQKEKLDTNHKHAVRKDREIKRMPSTLLGPTQYYVQFPKQHEALELIKTKSTMADPLSLFVYQNHESFRQFVVAHPETYWWYYDQQLPEERSSYEVIMENEPSYMYFDLEFVKELNPDKDGVKMTFDLIEVVLAYILKYYNLQFKKEHIVNLDSTSNVKFSRHLIFNTRNIAFVNNFHVGKFVKEISNDILDYVIDNKPNDVLKLFKKDNLENLIVITEKGKKLFIDASVYTKNRQFRIYKSKKWGKNSYFKRAPDCKYVPRENKYIRNKELQFFLDTLISFFSDKSKLALLEFDTKEQVNINRYVSNARKKIVNDANPKVITTQKSQYSSLDEHILKLVKPGRIRCCKFYIETNRIIYEILGNRYCRNIGRSHKSNNIYWVVDLTTRCAFQKCHDEDCQNFCSEREPLPEKVCFEFNDDLDDFLSNLPEP